MDTDSSFQEDVPDGAEVSALEGEQAEESLPVNTDSNSGDNQVESAAVAEGGIEI